MKIVSDEGRHAMGIVRALPVLLLVPGIYGGGAWTAASAQVPLAGSPRLSRELPDSLPSPHKAAADTGSAALAHKFILDGQSHDAYGLSYPVTFVFGLPPDASGLRACKYTDHWAALPTKLETEVYSGIEAARFDYEARKAYVSVSFPAESDTVSVAFTDESNAMVRSSFDRIARYYDDSQAVVVVTGDDWQEFDNDDFVAACSACQARRIWFTAGICTRGMPVHGAGPPNWDLIQQEVDEGFVEPASHSRYHLRPPYSAPQWGVQSSYEGEIGGSKEDILEHLSMPPLNKRGDTEYLYTWIEPYCVSDPNIRQLLGQHKYLADRRGFYGRWFADWDTTYGLYHRIKGTAWLDTLTAAEPLNVVFDWIVFEGNILYLMCHPRVVNWQSGPVVEHLDHVGNRPNIWYAGLGHLYVYHYMQDRNVIAYSAILSVGLEPGVEGVPRSLRLMDPAPNPFAVEACIGIELPARVEVRLGIYDVSGRLVRLLIDDAMPSGSHAVTWDGRDEGGLPLSGGAYFTRLEAGGWVSTGKLILSR